MQHKHCGAWILFRNSRDIPLQHAQLGTNRGVLGYRVQMERVQVSYKGPNLFRFSVICTKEGGITYRLMSCLNQSGTFGGTKVKTLVPLQTCVPCQISYLCHSFSEWGPYTTSVTNHRTSYWNPHYDTLGTFLALAKWCLAILRNTIREAILSKKCSFF